MIWTRVSARHTLKDNSPGDGGRRTEKGETAKVLVGQCKILDRDEHAPTADGNCRSTHLEESVIFFRSDPPDDFSQGSEVR